jgi:restriction system protein
VFVTTSDFTRDAQENAEFFSKRIVLINGERLGELMIRHNVGCRIQRVSVRPDMNGAFGDDKHGRG